MNSQRMPVKIDNQAGIEYNAVEVVLDKLRPMLIADGGNIELVDVKDSDVFVHLTGACGSCPSSTMTLRMGVERAIKAEIPSIQRVIQV